MMGDLLFQRIKDLKDVGERESKRARRAKSGVSNTRPVRGSNAAREHQEILRFLTKS